MYYPVGGPYVPSPLVYPLLMLPGDDGHVRFLNPRTARWSRSCACRGHFFASPWVPNSGSTGRARPGDTYVLDVSGLDLRSPGGQGPGRQRPWREVPGLPGRGAGHAVPAHGEASVLPRRRGGGTGTSRRPGRRLPPSPSSKERYLQHPAPVGPDVAVRLQIVEAMGGLTDPQVAPLPR